MWDSDIRQRLAYGDRDALAEVYDRCGRAVYSVALAVTRDRERAADITREVFARLWHRPLAYDPRRTGLRAWLAMLAHRLSLAEISAHGPVGANEADEVPQVLAALPALTRDAVRLAYFAGCTYREVATRLGVCDSTAKSRLRAGLRQLGPAPR